jgi:hypothetical protein
MEDNFKWYLSDIDLFKQGLGIAADGTAQPKDLAAFHCEKDEMLVEMRQRISLYEALLDPPEKQRTFYCKSKGYKNITILHGHIPSTMVAYPGDSDPSGTFQSQNYDDLYPLIVYRL